MDELRVFSVAVPSGEGCKAPKVRDSGASIFASNP